MIALFALLSFTPAHANPAPAPTTAPAPAAVTVGQAAPDFTLKDLDGKDVKLSSFKGKTVVIEWFNPGCPFVKYAHAEGPLRDQARKVASPSVVWLAVNSSAPGKEGNGVQVNRDAAKAWGMTHPVLVDESGTVGRSYGATTTPNMFVVDPGGKLVYAGALDNAPLGKAEGPVVNYVDAALADIVAGKPVRTSATKPYGCSVKYGG